MAADFPFRTQILSDADQARTDARLWRLRGLQAGGTLGTISNAEVLGFYLDPDERVALQAAQVFKEPQGRTGDFWDVVREAGYAITDAADAEGVLWNPRLHAFHLSFAHAYRRPPAGARFAPAQDALVADWVKSCADPAMVLQLVEAFPSVRIALVVTRHATVWTPALVRAVLRTAPNDNIIADWLRGRKDLPADAAIEFARFAVDAVRRAEAPAAWHHAELVFTDRQGDILALAPGLFPMAVAHAQAGQQERGHRTTSAEFVAKLDQMPADLWNAYVASRLPAFRAPVPARRSLLDDNPRDVIALDRLLSHPATSEAHRRELWAMVVEWGFVKSAVWNLGNHRNLPTPAVTAFIDEMVVPACLATNDAEALSYLVRLHGVSAEALAVALARGDKRAMREHILDNPWAMALPASGHLLLESTDRILLSKIARHAGVPDWVRHRVIERALLRWPEGAIAFLDGLAGSFPSGVPAACFQTLLASDNPVGRQAAIMALGRAWVRHDLPMAEAPAKPRAPKRQPAAKPASVGRRRR